MLIKKNLFTPDKYDYVRGIRPKVDCILCSVLNDDDKVERLMIYSGKRLSITLNLFPYNPGHIMIFPNKHKEDIRELTKKEWMDLYELQKLSINVIDKLYNPTGYNFGFNLGKDGGASIPHIHFHIVPRYKNEVGIIELFSDARIIVENPIETQKKLKKEFKKLNLKI